ncbi:Nucleobase-ascorbate transporter 11 [Glycine soja]|uniref:Nucleobase-ascorbate transporter 11 n=1 Tax=Glycine soja TaxID=3848 RepID=A0A445JLA4_GLYSO|nr:Nucleobase-ascorbate transporter 11 [Glycine soja]
MVLTMGGTDNDTANVISTMLFLSGVTTILHCYFGTQLSLVQGSSFVYLAPALVIINAEEFRNLTHHVATLKLQINHILCNTISQARKIDKIINPIVVAPTVAAVGLAFFSYGFPQAGTCMKISIPQIALVLLFTLGLDLNQEGEAPTDSSECRSWGTDISNALLTSAWLRILYPLQWGFPIFHFRTCIMMAIVSLAASVDSVGTYYSASLRVNLRPLSPGVVSRGIALEGLYSILAGLWGSGTGSTTLTENVQTIDTTKVASRRVVELGAAFMILFSFMGKSTKLFDINHNYLIPKLLNNLSTTLSQEVNKNEGCIYDHEQKILQLILLCNLHILCQGKLLGVSVGRNVWESEY